MLLWSGFLLIFPESKKIFRQRISLCTLILVLLNTVIKWAGPWSMRNEPRHLCVLLYEPSSICYARPFLALLCCGFKEWKDLLISAEFRTLHYFLCGPANNHLCQVQMHFDSLTSNTATAVWNHTWAWRTALLTLKKPNLFCMAMEDPWR